jgi:hypothetical protein
MRMGHEPDLHRGANRMPSAPMHTLVSMARSRRPPFRADGRSTAARNGLAIDHRCRSAANLAFPVCLTVFPTSTARTTD